MRFLTKKTEDGAGKGKVSLYCRWLGVSQQGFYQYLVNRNRPWKYQGLADAMQEIVAEDACNDTYDRVRMRQALGLKLTAGVDIPSERTVCQVMDQVGLSHHPRRKPNGITKADREARKSDDLLKRDVQAEKPLEKCVTDITELKAKGRKLYVSAIFDCFDLTALGLAMDDNMRSGLCARTLDAVHGTYPGLRGSIVHSGQGSQYTSQAYRAAVEKHGILQSMDSEGGRCHDSAHCESMWARMRSELFYDRLDPEHLTIQELKTLIWGYFMSDWNNRRICSANGGLSPAVKRGRYYSAEINFLILYFVRKGSEN